MNEVVFAETLLRFRRTLAPPIRLGSSTATRFLFLFFFRLFGDGDSVIENETKIGIFLFFFLTEAPRGLRLAFLWRRAFPPIRFQRQTCHKTMKELKYGEGHHKTRATQQQQQQPFDKVLAPRRPAGCRPGQRPDLFRSTWKQSTIDAGKEP